MLTSPQSEKVPNGTEAALNAVLVREQLRRLLAHTLFTNSKRYPVLLAYVVEQTLDGNGSDLKERTIGVEAFGREPNYDVNLDPVVRTTAAEVRKRLIQYYYSPDHSGELIIEIPVGSYAPVFREPAFQTPAKADAEVMAGQIASTFHGPHVSEVPPVEPKSTRDRRSAFRWVPITAGLLFAIFLGFGIGRVGVPGKTALPVEPSSTALFWQPITATSSRITYCLGVPTDAVDLQNTTMPLGERGTLNVYDVITLARSIVPLVPKNGCEVTWNPASGSQVMLTIKTDDEKTVKVPARMVEGKQDEMGVITSVVNGVTYLQELHTKNAKFVFQNWKPNK
ncbi:MAG: hypothetical protein ACRD2U_14515 [Terriglobales bacterium]